MCQEKPLKSAQDYVPPKHYDIFIDQIKQNNSEGISPRRSLRPRADPKSYVEPTDIVVQEEILPPVIHNGYKSEDEKSDDSSDEKMPPSPNIKVKIDVTLD